MLRLSLLALALLACRPGVDLPSVDPATARRGDVRSVERVAGVPSWLAKGLVWWSGLSARLPVEHGTTLYRVEYWTRGPAGDAVIASGLVALPRTRELRGVVSWQHGTATERSEVPSKPTPDEGVVASVAFAGHGYLLAAPDYLGLGSSPGRHPYYHTESTAASVVDLLRAARRLAEAKGFAWPEKLFLTGFSQGGHATIAALRELEAADEPGLRVTAAAPIAGPFDLSNLSVPRALEGEARSSSLYLGYLIASYSRVYGEPLGGTLLPQYARAVEEIFDGSRGGEAILEALPRNPREMFQPEFLESFEERRPNWLADRLRENDLVAFTPRAPVRLYYGALDVDVSPEEARTQARRWSERGADARAIDVGPFDHDASVLEAAPLVRAWFDELSARARRPSAPDQPG
jgi:pimeloyl-ACP methyl ester carboxylesterase